jgi:hypothetical protein
MLPSADELVRSLDGATTFGQVGRAMISCGFSSRAPHRALLGDVCERLLGRKPTNATCRDILSPRAHTDKRRDANRKSGRKFRSTPEGLEAIRKAGREFCRKERATPAGRTAALASSQARQAMRNKGGRRMIDLIARTGDDLWAGLERQLTNWPGMTVEAFMSGSIHLDHLVPMSLFDHEDADERVLCWSDGNLNPLWAEDNLSKSDSTTWLPSRSRRPCSIPDAEYDARRRAITEKLGALRASRRAGPVEHSSRLAETAGAQQDRQELDWNYLRRLSRRSRSSSIPITFSNST